ncbi:hypothetical protein LCGC14_2473940, partial [marine sediment metagenome]
MGIIESSSSPAGTHPSFASSHTRLKCDECGKEFSADCRIDTTWKFHGTDVGETD